MIIEEGKYYRNACGEKTGPMTPIADGDAVVSSPYIWTDGDGQTYNSDGRYSELDASSMDLVEEWTDKPLLGIYRGENPLWKGKAVQDAVATSIYLSGPMKGYPESNYPLFNTVAALLRKAGFEVYNPAEFEHDEAVFPLRRAFAEYSKFICEKADIIVLLPAWDKSLGVSAELALAKNCGLRVVELKDAILGIDSLLVV